MESLLPQAVTTKKRQRYLINIIAKPPRLDEVAICKESATKLTQLKQSVNKCCRMGWPKKWMNSLIFEGILHFLAEIVFRMLLAVIKDFPDSQIFGEKRLQMAGQILIRFINAIGYM